MTDFSNMVQRLKSSNTPASRNKGNGYTVSTSTNSLFGKSTKLHTQKTKSPTSTEYVPKNIGFITV